MTCDILFGYLKAYVMWFKCKVTRKIFRPNLLYTQYWLIKRYLNCAAKLSKMNEETDTLSDIDRECHVNFHAQNSSVNTFCYRFLFSTRHICWWWVMEMRAKSDRNECDGEQQRSGERMQWKYKLINGFTLKWVVVYETFVQSNTCSSCQMRDSTQKHD